MMRTPPHSSMEERIRDGMVDDTRIGGDTAIDCGQKRCRILRSPHQDRGQATNRRVKAMDSPTMILAGVRGESRSSGGNRMTVQTPVETPRSTAEANKEAEEQSILAGGSPRQELITRMRLSEEEAIGRCRNTLRKIRQAMSKQRNISMDVQNGIGQLEELMDVIEDYQRCWKNAEKERESSLKTLDGVKENSGIEENTISQNKRVATSPVDVNPVKKVRGKTPEIVEDQHNIHLLR